MVNKSARPYFPLKLQSLFNTPCLPILNHSQCLNQHFTFGDVFLLSFPVGRSPLVMDCFTMQCTESSSLIALTCSPVRISTPILPAMPHSSVSGSTDRQFTQLPWLQSHEFFVTVFLSKSLYVPINVQRYSWQRIYVLVRNSWLVIDLKINVCQFSHPPVSWGIKPSSRHYICERVVISVHLKRRCIVQVIAEPLGCGPF